VALTLFTSANETPVDLKLANNPKASSTAAKASV
jgi:hypothetical protein